MKHAEITGWGKCVPPAVLSNDDLATFIDTSDEWIESRTGIRERRICHANFSDMAIVAAKHALAAADLDPMELDLILLGSLTNDSLCPNTASLVQDARRDVAVLFGDACGAVVIEATDKEVGLLAAKIGCEADAKYAIQITNLGSAYSRLSDEFLYVGWNFEGQEVFKRAVKAMSQACLDVLEETGVSLDEVNLVVPHQANKRILDALAKRVGISTDKVFVNVHKYGNTSAGTIPVALTEALEEDRIKPGDYVLSATFGAGLTWGAALIRWGDRVTPLQLSDAALPPCDKTALEILAPHIKRYSEHAAKSTTD